MAAAQAYGECLPDQVNRIASLSDAQLGLISDIREIYKDRVALEKEYATKLAALSKKAADRKAKRIASLVVGDEPSKAWNDDTIRKSTFANAYSQLIASLDNSSQDHQNLSESLNSLIVEASKVFEKRHEDMKKKQMQLYQNLLSERDKVYSTRQKAKQKYDEECLEIDAYRQKQDRSLNDKHASRAAKQYEQQQIDMQNSKNLYLISIAVSNQAKNKFYGEDVPVIENNLQRLQHNLFRGLVALLSKAQSLHTSHLTALQSRITTVEESLKAIDIVQDQNLFIQHNEQHFSMPNDWAFEPCTGYYDTAEMVDEPAAKIFLQNKLARCRTKSQEIEPMLEEKRREVDQLLRIVNDYTSRPELGDIDEATNNYLDYQQQQVLLLGTLSLQRAEIDIISSTLGGDEGGQQPHSFKSASFSIPTTCAYCKSSIWGLSKQGKTCKACGLSVHAKCELKVPADCGTVRTERTNRRTLSVTEHKNSPFLATTSAISLTPSRSSVDVALPSARLTYNFVATSPFELSVKEGTNVTIIEDDDGSGWVKVADPNGGKGLVPASYLESSEEVHTALDSSGVLPSTKTRQTLGSGTYVRGLYVYQANGPDELDVKEGEMIELSSGATGGQNYSDGWWEGYDKNGKKGIFPSNYVEPI